MQRPVLAVGLLSLALALNGCGGRSARPVAVTQSFDQQMSCAQVASEIEANKVRINSLHKEDADRHGRNAAMATAGVLLIGVGALFLIDDGEAQEKEIQAYTARNNHLTQLAATNGCTDEEMAAAVAANSAAASANSAGGAAAPAASQLAVAPAVKQQQAQFDAWYSQNSSALRRALTDVVRDEGLLTSCAAGLNPTQSLNITKATVVGERAGALLVSIAYVKPGDSGHCQESREDAFLVRIEQDQLTEVSYAGPGAAPAPSATAAAPGTTAASATTGQPSLQAEFDAWYAGNSANFADRMNLYAHQKGLVSYDCGQHRVKITDIAVTSRSEEGYLANITIWKQGNWTNCEIIRTDAYLIRVQNDTLQGIEHRGPAAAVPAPTSASAPAAPSEQVAALPWTGTWHGETKLPNGRVTLDIVDGQVTTSILLGGRSQQSSGPLGPDGSYASSVTMVSWGGEAIIEVDGTFPVFTVGFTTSFNSEPDRTVTVARQ